MPYEDIYRFGASQNITPGSSGGVATSTTIFGTETYAVQLNFPAVATSTSGVRVAIGNAGEAPVADSTSALLAPNWPYILKVTPGQRVSAISNDAVIPNLNVVQLTK